jgi:hypothetical protein
MMNATKTISEPKAIRDQSDDELLSLLSDVDRAIRVAGDNATGMVAFRWAILTELCIRNAR